MYKYIKNVCIQYPTWISMYIYESLCIYVTATKLYFKRSKKMMLYIKMAGVYKLISRDAYNKSGDNKIY